ncbi:probable glutathione S-transferase [Mercurialis annua]|uniref:probable glutathione S-transferase n=1 Tax=Mercurialis annua TaxID=3986 RepID=UPI00215F31E4|nr:probable glutathione S-transferase [Mercurialis annua]
MDEIKLFGTWSSPFSCRVEWALKLKGINYEYIEENIYNKSALLLQYNPVHKLIPVLVHRGKPICESMVIVEYLDETWPDHPLLPTDPYERATARFWVDFIGTDKIPIWKVFCTSGEEQEKAVKECSKMLTILEEEALGKENKKFFGGEKIGIVDIACGVCSLWLELIEEVAGIQILQPHNFPNLHQWTINFMEEPSIKEKLPDREKLLNLFKNLRPKMLEASISSG